jgi:hypothetical protein
MDDNLYFFSNYHVISESVYLSSEYSFDYAISNRTVPFKEIPPLPYLSGLL